MDTKNQPQRLGRLKGLLSSVLVVFMATTLLLSMSLQTAHATPSSTEVQAQADEASAQLAASETEMTLIGQDYRSAVEAHDAALMGMEEAQARIDAAEEIISETQERLGSRAAQSYRQGPLSFFNVIFGASSFEEFTTSWDLINVLNQENATLIQTNKDARLEAQTAHEEYTAQEKAAAERLAEAEAIKVRAEELIAEQSAVLAGLEAEVAELVEQEQATRLAAEAAAAEGAQPATPVSPSSNPSKPAPPIYVAPEQPAGGYGDVVAAAASRIGCPYVYGATGPNYFDCSGLTSWSYSQAGRGWIGRTDGSQYASASARWSYSSGGASPGDVLWWPGHVAIYAGGGSYIHAPYSGQSVCYSSWNINAATVLRF